MEENTLTLSVHQLVDNVLRSGDIDDRVFNKSSMVEGTAVHGRHQKKQRKGYLSEVPLTEIFHRGDTKVILQGRADGIYFEGPTPVIDEIKSTTMDLEEFASTQLRWHLGQALCYAAMFLYQTKLPSCRIKLTYISQNNNSIMKEFFYDYSDKQIEEEVNAYIDEYLALYRLKSDHRKERDISMENMQFPYKHFRVGQKDLMEMADKAANEGGIYLVEAPTGIGKTMSVLFPYLKALKNGELDRIFYLTAKNITGNAAIDAMELLREKGYKGRESLLLGKDKMCFSPGCGCNPDECPYAKDYYTKKNQTILKATSSMDHFDPILVKQFCQEEMMCPFEFQLDLSEYSDLIICDYNYYFDPLVYLERYFENPLGEDFLIAIDEAHNLLDRGRDMYSASLSSKAIDSAYYSIRGKASSIKKKLLMLKDELNFLASTPQTYDDPPRSVLELLDKIKNAEIIAKKKGKISFGATYKEFSREASRFSYLAEMYWSEAEVCYSFSNNGDERLSLYCVDPSAYLYNTLYKAKGALLFSATLSPIDYFQKATLGKDDLPYLLLPSPFPKENFLAMAATSVSVRYKDRENSYEQVAAYLSSFVKSKKGNYFIYFPSYEYLNRILPLLDFGKAEVYVQDRGMREEDKRVFLSNFVPSPEITTVGILTIGGAFSEGIDLIGERLIGVAVVGIGLPQVNVENELIKQRYDEKNGRGFEYAYVNPGINRIMQAVGRLIRSENDIGAALLIDDRYTHKEYRSLFTSAWGKVMMVSSPKQVQEALNSFYLTRV